MVSLREMLKAKINNAIVTGGNVDYDGSITVPGKILKKAGLKEFEKVLIVDDTNGERIETYAIAGKANGKFTMNGAAALKIKTGTE